MTHNNRNKSDVGARSDWNGFCGSGGLGALLFCMLPYIIVFCFSHSPEAINATYVRDWETDVNSYICIHGCASFCICPPPSHAYGPWQAQSRIHVAFGWSWRLRPYSLKISSVQWKSKSFDSPSSQVWLGWTVRLSRRDDFGGCFLTTTFVWKRRLIFTIKNQSVGCYFVFNRNNSGWPTWFTVNFIASFVFINL